MAQRAARRARVWSRIGEKGGIREKAETYFLRLCGEAHLQKVFYGLPWFCLGAVLCQGRIVGGLCPFAPAFLCAAQMKEKHRLAVAAGGIFGSLIALDGAGLLVCVLLTLLCEGLRFFRVRPNALLCLVLTGLLQLMLPLLWAETLHDLLLTVLSAAASALLAPLYAGGLEVSLQKRKYLCPEELLGVLLPAASALAGLRSLRLLGASPVLAALALLCITVGFFGGAAKGALCGVLCGLFPALTLPADGTLVVAYPLLGLLCGMPVTKSRLWVLPAALAAALLSAALDKSLLMLTHGIELAAALAGFFPAAAGYGEVLDGFLNRDSAPAQLPEPVADAAAQLRSFAGLYRRLACAGGEASGQLAAVGQALASVAQRMEAPPVPCPALTECVREVLEQAGVPAESAAVCRREGHLQAKITLRCLRRDGLCSRELPRLVSRTLDRPMRMVPCGLCPKTGSCALEFSEEPTFRCIIGTASRPVRERSGDTCSSAELPGDKLLAALSDGMGHGETANAESRAATELLEDYLAAGFAPEDALPAVNDALLRSAAAERFATMDLLLLNLRTGCADVMKLGSAPSYVRRGREIIVLSGESLPLGILQRVKPSMTRFPLQDGDTLFLLTDGVCDALSGDENALQRLLATLPLRTPESTAEALLAAVSDAGDPKDDMTCMVIRICAV